MDFYVGQKVVCINGSKLNPNSINNQPPLIQDRIYTILNIITATCGHVGLDVGIYCTPANIFCYCGNLIQLKTPIHWCAAKRFIPLDEYSAMETEIQESLKPQYQEQ